MSDPTTELLFEKALAATGGKGADKGSEIGKMFGKWKRTNNLVMAVLGDETYARRFKMPGWNISVTILQDHRAALRHYHSLGLPTSKEAHRQRAEHFENLAIRFSNEHTRLLDLGAHKYGNQGSLISGGFREHWPAKLKDRVRFFSHGRQLLKDAASLHRTLSKTRSPIFK